MVDKSSTERTGLTGRRCVPCGPGTPKLDRARAESLLGELDGWRIEEEKLVKRFSFKDFRLAMQFLNRVADVAEQEAHHPDFSVHYNRVDFAISTHEVHGLSENDFILAAKIDALA